jgi:hypothetical protein
MHARCMSALAGESGLDKEHLCLDNQNP